MLYLGIDQHKSQITVNLRAEDGGVILQRQVSTRWEKIRAFFDDLARRAADEGGFMAIVEVCGMNPWLIKMLEEYECREIVITQPDHRPKKKTDRRDASFLSNLLWLNRERLAGGRRAPGMRRINPPTAREAEHRQLTIVRQVLTKRRTAVLNALHKVLRKHNLEQDRPTKLFQTKKVRGWLAEIPLGEIDRMEVNQLLERWALLEEQLKTVGEKISVRAETDEQARLLQSMPGMGEYSSLAISSRIGDIGRFKGPGSLANYWGLTPGCRNSGEATQRLGSITKQGSKIVRYLLGQAVVKVLRFDMEMRKWYKQIKKRRGSKIARVAVMRRMATIIWHMLKKKRKYRYESPIKKHREFEQFSGEVQAA
jgi:transposase